MSMDHLRQLRVQFTKIKHDEVKSNIILSDIGMVTETDVTLAKASKCSSNCI